MSAKPSSVIHSFQSHRLGGCPELTLSSQLNAERTLKLSQNLLVRHSTTTLVIVNDRRLLIDPSGKILLGHCRLLRKTGLGHGLSDVQVDLWRGGNLVLAVDLGEALTIGALDLVAGSILYKESQLVFVLM